MIIKNVKVYTPERTFTDGEIRTDGALFGEIMINTDSVAGQKESGSEKNTTGSQCNAEMILDGQGCYAIPALIDLHFHGCMGHDVCDGTKEALAEIARYEASVGVTAIAPATMTLPVEELEHVLAMAAQYKEESECSACEETAECNVYEEAAECDMLGKRTECGTGRAYFADLVGLNMEGPFISPEKKGAQDARNIIPCDADICRRFLEASKGLVKFVGVAPEESENAIEFIEEMKGQVNLSLAHTNADYDRAAAAFAAGANHAVHLYNAMPSFTHRAPGVVGAAADYEHVTAEIICDGVHIHPSAVRAAFRMFGSDRMILISDSMRATGMPDGRYLLGGLEVDVTGNRAVLVSDGALAGSATNLMDCMRTAVQQMGIPLETAVACASANPAKKLGIYDRYGSIEAGKNANLVLLDQDLKVKAVIKDGVRIR